MYLDLLNRELCTIYVIIVYVECDNKHNEIVFILRVKVCALEQYSYSICTAFETRPRKRFRQTHAYT